MMKVSLIIVASMLLVAALAPIAHAEDTPHTQARQENFLAKAQSICPVSGKELTSMGGPVKAAVDGKTVFLCCRGCVGRSLDARHWATVQANLRTARLALVQQICPVSGKDLLSMGGPIQAEVGGQTAFLCCKGCQMRQVQREHWDQIQANLKAAQKKCPVRDVELGSEAVPVVVDKRVVYVCCDAGYCIKKVKADPDKYLAMVDTMLANSLQEAASPE